MYSLYLPLFTWKVSAFIVQWDLSMFPYWAECSPPWKQSTCFVFKHFFYLVRFDLITYWTVIEKFFFFWSSLDQITVAWTFFPATAELHVIDETKVMFYSSDCTCWFCKFTIICVIMVNWSLGCSKTGWRMRPCGIIVAICWRALI